MKLILYLLIYISTLVGLNANNILHIKINDAISPATHKYFNDAFLEAKKLDSKIILVELDTPGGLVTTTREMVQEILNSNIPIVMYVSPKGARAASAGTFLMYASHIAAMAPSTNIGAATPVNLGGSNPMTPKKEEKGKEKTEQMQDAMQKKVLNDTIAYIKSIAEHTNRNVQWAIEAVKEGNSISASEALEKNVIDVMANDINDLLKKIDGKKIKVNDKEIVLDTKNTNIILFEASWKTQILMSIANPNVAYIFLILAIYGILFEMMNPGSIFPGVIGAISALIALYSLNILPFSYVGLLLIFLGIALMLAEVTVSGFGILGIAGVTSFALGSFLLFDEKTLGIGISYPIIIAFTLVSLGFFGYLLGFLIKVRKEKSTIGIENLLGKKAVVVSRKNNEFKVLYEGELWTANSDEELKENDEVIIEKIDGLIVQIRSIK